MVTGRAGGSGAWRLGDLRHACGIDVLVRLWRLARHPDRLQRVRANLNRRSISLRLARRALARRDWAAAQRHYRNVLAMLRRAPSSSPKEVELLRNEAELHLSHLARLLSPGAYRRHIDTWAAARRAPRAPRIAVVTALVGPYDSLKLPARLSPRCDYLVFTDQPVPGCGVYQVRPLPYRDPDPTRAARYVKSNLHKLLPDHDHAIWIDANVALIGDIEPLLEDFLRSRRAVGAIRHPLRDSVFEEVAELLRNGKDGAEVIDRHAAHLRAAGFDCADLIETNLMMFDLKSPRIGAFFEAWWSEIDRFSRRDQLSVNHALRQAGIAWHVLMARPLDTRTHPALTRTPHDMDQQVVHDLAAMLDGARRGARPEGYP